MTARLVRNLTAVTVAAGLATAGLVGQAGVASAATTVSIHANHRTYAYGGTAYVSGHVSTGRAVVTVTVRPAGHAQQVIHVQAGPKGAWSAHGPVFYNTTITATYRSAHESVRVGTHVRMRTRLAGTYKTSGGYHLAHPGSRPTFALGVSPNKTNHHVTIRLQVLSGGHWRTVETRSYKLESHSVTAVTFTGRTGHTFRIRGEYHADATNLGRNSAYSYVRFA